MKRARVGKMVGLVAGAACLMAVSPEANEPRSHIAGPMIRPDASNPAQPFRAPRLPGFAADLAQQRVVDGPSAWRIISEEDAWARLSRVPHTERQQARWNYARSLIGQEQGAEAFGVLEVMRQDDPDLMMVDSFRVAHGAALTMLGRYSEAVSILGVEGLRTNPEACAWRMRALAHSNLEEPALGQLSCAWSALGGSRPKPFVLAAARASVEGGKPEQALHFLKPLPDTDPAANLYRGRALLAQGKSAEARLAFARVEHSGSYEQRMDARLSQVEGQVQSGTIGTKAALKSLNDIRYAWRGDNIEERALQLAYSLNEKSGNLSGALATGATLFRYYDPAQQGDAFLTGLRTNLSNALDPAQKFPLEKAASLYWDYRDLAPSGAEGDLMANRLAARLQQAGLYERSADLLSYQLFVRAGDLAKGPLSAKVATLYILSGRPDRALTTLRKTNDPSFPDDMIAARKRVEAAGLSQLGRIDEAMAVLQDVPQSQLLRAEILWKQRDWTRYAEETAASLPKSGALGAVEQAVVLRHAISLAMLGQEGALAQLNGKYAASFSGLKTAPVFQMLTGSPSLASGAVLSQAMAALPSASPAGDFADLLERAPGSRPQPVAVNPKPKDTAG